MQLTQSLLQYVVWSPDPEIFSFWGIRIVWYGLLWATSFLAGQQIMFHIFRKENKTDRDVESLTMYMLIATIVGARLGHVFFYEPDIYLANPIKILKIWEGGLASHGATIGILTGIFMYARKRPDQSYLWVLDRIVIVVALAGALIRFGNFINSEIEGKPTDAAYGVVFARVAEDALGANSAVNSVSAQKGNREENTAGTLKPVDLLVTFDNRGFEEDGIRNYLDTEAKYILSSYPSVQEHIFEDPDQPLNYTLRKTEKSNFEATIFTMGVSRHPAQLYESFSIFLLFLILLFIWHKQRALLPEGTLFGIFLIVVFGLRFLYEFLKENQVAFEDNLALNMGQWLSIPLVIAGVVVLAMRRRKV